MEVSTIIAVVIGAILVERLVDIIKMIVTSQKIQWQVIVSMVIGVVLSIGYKWDLPLAIGFASGIPFLGEVLTGLLISGGSNFIYDLIQTMITTLQKKVG